MASNIDVLNESTRVAQEAAKAAGLTFTPGAEVVNGQIKPVTIPATMVNTPASDLKFPSGTSNTDLSSALAATKAMSSALTSQRETDLTKEQSAYTEQLKGLLGRQEQKPVDLNTAMEQAGVNRFSKEINDLGGLIATKTAALESGLTNIEGKAIPMELLTGEQAQLRRQGLAEIGALQARQQVLQGNLTAAKDAAQRAVDLIYAPEEQRIKNIQTFLELNQAELTKEEKKKADLLSEAMRVQSEELANKKVMQSYALNASANYPDAGILPGDSPEEVDRKKMNSPTWRAETTKKTTGGNMLTINEAKNLGLPVALAGRTEEDIANELSGENVPEWFRQFAQEKEKASIVPTRLKSMWDTFRNSVLGEKTTASSGGGIDFDSL